MRYINHIPEMFYIKCNLNYRRKLNYITSFKFGDYLTPKLTRNLDILNPNYSPFILEDSLSS